MTFCNLLFLYFIKKSLFLLRLFCHSPFLLGYLRIKRLVHVDNDHWTNGQNAECPDNYYKEIKNEASELCIHHKATCLVKYNSFFIFFIFFIANQL